MDALGPEGHNSESLYGGSLRTKVLTQRSKSQSILYYTDAIIY